MIDLTVLYRKKVLQDAIDNVTTEEKERNNIFKQLLLEIETNEHLSANEKEFSKITLTYFIKWREYDFETWEIYRTGFLLFQFVVSHSESLNLVFNKIDSQFLDSKKEKLLLKMRFFIWDLCENFDLYFSQMNDDLQEFKTISKEGLKKEVENCRRILDTQLSNTTSFTLNMGQKKRVTLHNTPEIEDILSQLSRKAMILFGGFNILSSILKRDKEPFDEIMILSSEKTSKIRKTIFNGIYNDFELEGNSSIASKKVFLYDIFSLIFPHLPESEEQYYKTRKSSEQEFRDYKLEVVRNLVG